MEAAAAAVAAAVVVVIVVHVVAEAAVTDRCSHALLTGTLLCFSLLTDHTLTTQAQW